jgi:hypothetical protein
MNLSLYKHWYRPNKIISEFNAEICAIKIFIVVTNVQCTLEYLHVLDFKRKTSWETLVQVNVIWLGPEQWTVLIFYELGIFNNFVSVHMCLMHVNGTACFKNCKQLFGY